MCRIGNARQQAATPAQPSGAHNLVGEPQFHQLEPTSTGGCGRWKDCDGGVMVRANAGLAMRQRDAFVRAIRLVALLEGRPPRRPLAREARAFA